MRIVSLLPSLTELVCALDAGHRLTGRSHECDYPDDVLSLPACTEPKYRPDGDSYQIDQRVKGLLRNGLSVYRVDEQLLQSLDPDIILTQDQCEVCAASFREVQQAVEDHLDSPVRVVSVAPSDLEGIFQSFREIGTAIRREEQSIELIREMRDHFIRMKRLFGSGKQPRVAVIEWMKPLMSAGNWVPELIENAGGRAVLTEKGSHSETIAWNQILQEDPDYLFVSPCGYGLFDTLREINSLRTRDGWESLRAVKNGRVYVLDGNHYFNRPGPRVIDSALICAEIMHPGRFEEHYSQTYKHNGWFNLADIPIQE